VIASSQTLKLQIRCAKIKAQPKAAQVLCKLAFQTTMPFSKLRVCTNIPPLNQILILQTWTRADVLKTHSNFHMTKVLILAQAANMHIIDSKPTQSNLCKKKVLSDNIAQRA
jgi:hypothetical protein